VLNHCSLFFLNCFYFGLDVSYLLFNWLYRLLLDFFGTIMDFSDAGGNILDFSLDKIMKTCKS